MAKTKIGIIYGGKSVEHEISIKSAKNIVQYLNLELFEPILIGIDKLGNWYLNETVQENIQLGSPLTIKMSSPFSLITHENKEIILDILFPVLHGTNGEDGSVQGLLQVLNKPYVGTGILGSAVSMSKLASKYLMQAHGIPTSKFLSFHDFEKEKIDYSNIVSQLGLPFMVKAANLGSSVGINKVTDEITFKNAINEAFKFDNLILIEAFINGRELECALLGNNEPEASAPGEIIISDSYDFYTYEAKYLDENAVKIEIPAKVSPAKIDEIKEISKKCYLALNCNDFARVDLFLLDSGEILVNEVNTIPGFTNASMFPMMWGYEGLAFSDLITKLIHVCFERFNNENLKSSMK